MGRHFKIHQQLTKEQLAELEEYARHPARTARECHELVKTWGYDGSDTSVEKWLRNFKMKDRFKASSEMAKSLMATVRAGGEPALITQAAIEEFAQIVWTKAVAIREGEPVTTKDLYAIGFALRNLTQSNANSAKLRADVAAVMKAEKKKGSNPGVVMSRLREYLGMPPEPDEIEPPETPADDPADAKARGQTRPPAKSPGRVRI